jgi:alcohol-forming fatty acyl-CoA reductase
MNSLPRSQPTIAAFFDVDGTLLPSPSLEWRFFAAVRRDKAVAAVNYLLWAGRALQLARHGASAWRYANKMYLRGISTAAANRFAAEDANRMFLPAVFPEAQARIAWHAACNHRIFLVTGTIEPLARCIADDIEFHLASRGIHVPIEVCATQLERQNQRWTGRIAGSAMFGEAKARALWRIAGQERLELSHSYAYGDSKTDRWMLGAVGNPIAVNPSPSLRRIAQLRTWPVLHWKETSAHSRSSAVSVQGTMIKTNVETPA